MKALTTNGLTELITLIKSTFIPNTNVENTTEIDVINATTVGVDTTPTSASNNLITSGGVYSALGNKQDTLVSGTNIKTINNTSLLGSGDITIGGGGTATDVQINGVSITSNNVADIITEGTYNSSTNKIATMADVPSEVTETTVSNWGFTKNIGTVTSVNNVSPVSGNVTLSIPTDTLDLTNGAGYITSSALSGYATETWVGQQGYALSSSLATVATSGSYNDLSNTPTIPAAQVNSDWNAISGVAQILNKPSLATVATTGDYTDLINKPTIPDISNLANKDLSNLSATGEAHFQAPLVSGTNIKTINNTSILGSGNISIAPTFTYNSVTETLTIS